MNAEGASNVKGFLVCSWMKIDQAKFCKAVELQCIRLLLYKQLVKMLLITLLCHKLKHYFHQVNCQSGTLFALLCPALAMDEQLFPCLVSKDYLVMKHKTHV